MLPVLLLIWLMLVVVTSCLVLLMPAFRGWELYRKFGGTRAVTCPETHRRVAVEVDGMHAAVTGLSGRARLRLVDCTRWPERAGCGQECLPEARAGEPFTGGEVALPPAKRIYHLPVLIAAFVAWLIGATLHSPYLLRARWMAAAGSSRSELRQSWGAWAPHLLSLAMCLLFAYGVAWLLALRRNKNAAEGVIFALAFWALLVAASFAATGWAGISGDLVRIEIGYTFLAAVVVGAIVGGVRKVRIPAEFRR